MSRVGKRPIEVVDGIKIDYQPPIIKITGPKGTLERKLHPLVALKIDGSVITTSPVDDSREANALWGLTRSLVFNMVQGVSKGHRSASTPGLGILASV